MKLIQHSDKIWTIENFLSPKECEDLIIFSEQADYQEAQVSFASGAKMAKGIRNNYRLMYQDIDLAADYWEKLKPFCPEKIEDRMTAGLNERFRFYKYEATQRFKKHKDGSFRRNENEESKITFLIYLNDDFKGGETAFEDIVIQPKTGSALCFIHELKHEGKPVIEGLKYVLRSDVMYALED